MNDPGRRSPQLLGEVLQSAGGDGRNGRSPARLRVGTMVAMTTISLTVGAGVSALGFRQAPMPVRAAASVRQATPAPPPSLTFANQLTVGPDAASGFTQGGDWSTAGGGAPGFTGPDSWLAAGNPAGEAAWTEWGLGSPTGGLRWDQVHVLAWIPNQHALAHVRYTVTSTDGAAQAVQTFDVSQRGLDGWYTLPASFQIGTATERTGTITVRMTYLGEDAGLLNGCEMSAAQVQFQWS
jgi:hypothetical protein